MAIKLPDPGNGIPEQKTGNDEWTNMKIVRDNFADQSNAASRLVGKSPSNIPLVSSVPELAMGGLSNYAHVIYETPDVNDLTAGVWLCNPSRVANTAPAAFGYQSVYAFKPSNHGGESVNLQLSVSVGETSIYYRTQRTATRAWDSWGKLYSSLNTTVEENTNYLKVSSPVLRLKHDDFEKEHEAKAMDIKVENTEIGVYKVTGTTGLRSDGWYFSPPKDEHNNVLCMVEVEEDGGIVTVKTYKKKFDFETVSIVPDYEQPTDIPEGAVVMLRFNDLPQEQLDEPIE